MPIDDKPLERFAIADLEELIDNQVSEQRTLDYKRALPGTTDAEKREFLRDVSSFANTAGGHLVYGMTESNGIPRDLPGIQLEKPDAEQCRLENLLRDGVRPRISRIDFRFMPITNGSYVVVVRIPTSWAKPHMVTYNDGKFYARNSNGKYPMDIDELRSAFLSGYAVKGRIERFRRQRIELVQRGALPVRPFGVPFCLLQVVPFNLGENSTMIDVSSLEGLDQLKNVISGTCPRLKYSLDGLTIHNDSSDQGDATYCITVFRDGGAIELVHRVPLIDQRRPDLCRISEILFEQTIREKFSSILQVQRAIGISPPLAVMLTLVGARTFDLNISCISNRWYHGHPIEIDPVELPDVCIDRYDGDPDQTLRPLFDGIWLAAGWPRSMNYDESGRRVLWHEQDK
jgi:hypothetical protein